MVEMAEELGPFLTRGTSGCPSMKGVVALVQGIWKVEPSPISQLTQNKQDEAFCCVACPALAIPVTERPRKKGQAPLIWPSTLSPAPANIWECIQLSPQLSQPSCICSYGVWVCPQTCWGAPAPKQAWCMLRARAPLSLAGEFVISPVEGELRVRKDAELDRENIAFYNLTIAARDRGVPPLSSTVSPHAQFLPFQSVASSSSPPPPSPCPFHTGLSGASPALAWGVQGKDGKCTPCFSPWQMMVGVRVLDINDNDPVLLNLPMNLTLSENAAVSSFVTRVLAHDADQGPNALLTFDITAGNTENAFYINSTVWPRGGMLG